MTTPPATQHRNFYGRIRGKALKPAQKRYLEDLAQLGLQGVAVADNPERTPLDLTSIFGDRPVWLEIGFGSGEHLVHQAALHPDVGFIGCEPFINGVATLLGKIRKASQGQFSIEPRDTNNPQIKKIRVVSTVEYYLSD